MKPKGLIHQTLQPETISILRQIFGGGRTIPVPKSTAHPSAKRYEVLIGLAETANLINAFAGGPVYLPSGQEKRGRPIPPSLAQVKRLSRTMSAAKIAARFGCSARSIYHKRKRIRDAEAQTRQKSPTATQPNDGKEEERSAARAG